MIERSPADLTASKPAASGTALETLAHFDFFLSLQLTGGGGATAAALAGVESSGRQTHNPRLRASFLYFLLDTPSGGRRLWPQEMAAPPPAPFSVSCAVVLASARCHGAAVHRPVTLCSLLLPFFVCSAQGRARRGIHLWRPEGRRRGASRRHTRSPMGERAAIEWPCGGA